jgi:hypothetical protein
VSWEEQASKRLDKADTAAAVRGVKSSSYSPPSCKAPDLN